MLVRLIDYLKVNGITALLTALSGSGSVLEQTNVGVSSIVDTWLLLRDIELGGERNRGLYVLKSRGMAHSNQIREFVLTPRGIELLEVYTGPEGVLTGSARVSQEARERSEALTRRQEVDRQQRELGRRQKVLEAQMAALRAEFEVSEEEARRIAAQEQAQEDTLAQDRDRMLRRREGRAGETAGAAA